MTENVTALIEADKAVRADMEARYKDGPYQDGMYGTGMLLELARRGFVVVPQRNEDEVPVLSYTLLEQPRVFGHTLDELRYCLDYTNLHDAGWRAKDE